MRQERLAEGFRGARKKGADGADDDETPEDEESQPVTTRGIEHLSNHPGDDRLGNYMEG